jgi:hypothetical protein
MRASLVEQARRTSMRRMVANGWIWPSIGLGIVLGALVSTLVGLSTATASAQDSEILLTANQMRINQRISQVAVRRSNEALALLAPIRGGGPGWPSASLAPGAVTGERIAAGAVGTPSLADGAVTEAKLGAGAISESRLAAGVQERLFTRLFAGVNADGTIEPLGSSGRKRSAGVIGSTRLNLGLYAVTFQGNMSACVYLATLRGNALEGGEVAVGTTSDDRVVVVTTRASDGPPADRAFDVAAVC